MHGGQKSSIPLEKAEIYATITILYFIIEKPVNKFLLRQLI